MAKQKTAKKRTAAKKSPAKKSSARRRTRRKSTGRAARGSALPQVRVRMFRQGLGDCFLLTLDAGGDERHLLIDCGTLGNKANQVSLDQVAEEIHAALGPDGRLHVVVATHEHQDHLSGFHNQKLQQLQGKVDQAWLAWTENPADPDAQKLAKYKHDLGQALAAVAAAAPQSDVGQQVSDLLGFAGDVSAGPLGFAKTVDAAMDFVRTGLGAKVTYHEPGDLLESELLEGFRIYVLGPPRDKDQIKNLGQHGSDELFGLRGAALLEAAATQNQRLSAEELQQCELQRPFDMRYIQADKQLLAQQYPHYLAAGEQWRAIDQDWHSLASNLALQLDSLTNNTSLALAIERVADGKVLLFPADAQLGNWLSWHQEEIQWTIPDSSGRERKVSAADLLERTVFYKVGHHASHNATARGQGLELMQQEDELTAFIPVDRELALSRNPKGSWQMPAEPLYRRLLEKCQGRVARSDLGWAARPTAAQESEKEFKNLASKSQWNEWQKSQKAARHITVGPMFIEYLLK